MRRERLLLVPPLYQRVPAQLLQQLMRALSKRKSQVTWGYGGRLTRKSFHWPHDSEWLQYLPSVFGPWERVCAVCAESVHWRGIACEVIVHALGDMLPEQ